MAKSSIAIPALLKIEAGVTGKIGKFIKDSGVTTEIIDRPCFYCDSI